jgi:DNA repair protein RadC
METYGLHGLKTVDVHELTNEGLSSAKAALLSAVCELAIRLSLPGPGEHIQIRMPADAATLLRPMMAHLDHEEFRVLVLNTKNYVVANILLYQGTLNSSTVRIAEILRHAIVRKCPNLIVAHNHPSLDPEPSPEDYDMTKQLVEATRLLDLELLDHLVIGDPHHVSLKERLLWK